MATICFRWENIHSFLDGGCEKPDKMALLTQQTGQPSKRWVTLALVSIVLTTGCLGGGPGVDGQTPTPMEAPPTGDAQQCPPIATPTQQTTATETPPEGTPTATASGFTYGPDRETPVVLSNDFSEQVEMRVHVSCEAIGETVHDDTYSLISGARREPVNLTTFTPENAGSSVTVVVTVRDTTRSVTLETTDCGGVTARLLNDGELLVDTTAC